MTTVSWTSGPLPRPGNDGPNLRRCIASATVGILALTTLGIFAPSAFAVPEEPAAAQPRFGGTGEGPAALMTSTGASAKRAAGRSVRRVKVEWRGSSKKRGYTRSIGIPGIGALKTTCQARSVQIQLRSNNRDAETQLWMSKYEIKNGRRVVAVKTGRIYTFATASDDGTGGTGGKTNEGFNQQSPPENYSSGYIDGIISRRPGRNEPANAATPGPVTTFRLNWYWNDFRYPLRFRYCKVDAVLKTSSTKIMGLNWHGDADAGLTSQTTKLSGIGRLRLTCEPGSGQRSVTFYPRSKKSTAYIETIRGEGPVENRVKSVSRSYNETTRRFGPYPLPSNAMMRLFLSVGRTTRPFIISSNYVTNNPNTALNFCEVAAGAY